jgi:hypothetical protein
VGGQVVDRIVSSADDGDLHHVHVCRRPVAAVADDGVRPLADVRRVRGSQYLVYPVEALEFEMRPLLDGIARSLQQRSGEGGELFVPGRLAGAERFIRPVGAHQPPLVMVARQPKFRQVLERLVRRDDGRRQMAVVVEDGQAGNGRVKPFRRFVREEKIVTEKLHRILLVGPWRSVRYCRRDSRRRWGS